ncbi:unnamed protein product [Clonostachys solani]|uniref:Uncharacterized protein n=1 Tax=Clonostachys solani TaxID=160281 RepID=A0A9N9YZL2_9HYPO|nr:unnamed protein product [Clonostachys solani]
MVNLYPVREIDYNCRAPVWVFKDARKNIFLSPQKELSKNMIIRYKTGRRAERAVLKSLLRSIRAAKRIYTDAHALSIFSTIFCCRGERLWIIGATRTAPINLRVVSLDTQRSFRILMSAVCFVPQLKIVDESGTAHYITPVAENWFAQWPVGRPDLVVRRDGPLPDEPTLTAAVRKQSFRNEWALYKGFNTGGQLCASAQEWENKMEEDGLKYLQEFADTPDMGEELIAPIELPMRPAP